VQTRGLLYVHVYERARQASLSQPYPNARITLSAVSANKLYDIKRPLLQSSHSLGSVG